MEVDGSDRFSPFSGVGVAVPERSVAVSAWSVALSGWGVALPGVGVALPGVGVAGRHRRSPGRQPLPLSNAYAVAR